MLSDAGSRDAFVEAMSRDGRALLGEIPRLNLVKLSCPQGAEVETASGLRRVAGVAFAQPNGLGGSTGLGDLDDPCLPEQWHLKNNGGSGASAGADVDVEGAWAITTGKRDIVVAVVDTGIDFDHPEFVGRLLPGFDFYDEDPDPSSDGNHGHFVAGLIGGIADNGYAGVGLDQACSILPVKALAYTGLGNAFDVAQGIDYAAAAGADVINLSVGFLGDAGSILQPALEAAHEAGCILVDASSNFGAGFADLAWPSASPDTITLGSTNDNDIKVTTSGTGKALDFTAPGNKVVSCLSLTWPSPCDVWSGTSFACAVVSSVISLMLAVRPDLTQEQVYALLAAGAQDQVGPPEQDLPGWDKHYGYGRISAGASLRLLTRLLETDGAMGVPSQIAFFKGGHQLIKTRVDPALRGSPWITLGSLSGSEPGVSLGHLIVPLNADHYFLETLNGSGDLLHPPFGIVPEDGVILQTVDIPAKWLPDFPVVHLDHVVVVVHEPPFVSEPVPLVIEP